MKMLAILLLLMMTSSTMLVAQFKKDFKDFAILKLPIDRQFIGTIRLGSSFTGQPVKDQSITASNSLEKYFSSDSNQFKFEILEVVNSSFKLDPSKFQVTDLKELEVADCVDFGKLPLARNNQVVISTVRVKSLEITSKKAFDGELKVDLGNFIKKTNLQFDPKITYQNNKATIKSGKDLIVAVRIIKIESNPKGYFFSSKRVKANNDNSFEFFEPDFGANSQIAFINCDNLANFVKEEKDYTKHQGCFTVAFVNPSVSTSDNELIGGQLLICPRPDNVRGDIKLDNTYRPASQFQSPLPRPIGTILTGTRLVRYTFQIQKINSLKYSNRPEANTPNSNFILDTVQADWELKKFIYDFSFVTK